MRNMFDRVGILVILVVIVSTVSISQLGQVGVLDNICEFITGECCPGDIASIASCDDGDSCTADYCWIRNGNEG